MDYITPRSCISGSAATCPAHPYLTLLTPGRTRALPLPCPPSHSPPPSARAGTQEEAGTGGRAAPFAAISPYLSDICYHLSLADGQAFANILSYEWTGGGGSGYHQSSAG